MPSDHPSGERRMLRSWKEIAAYLEVDTRTAQRWQTRTDVPIYRHGTGDRGHPTAYTDELDRWLTMRAHDPSHGQFDGHDPSEQPGDSAPAVSDAAALQRPGPRRINPIAITVGAVALAAIAFQAGWQRQTQAPVRAELAFGRLRAFGPLNERLWERPLPGSGAIAPDGSQGVDRMLVADITGDNRADLLVNLIAPPGTAGTGHLVAFQDDGELLWDHAYDQTKPWRGRPFEARFEGRVLRVVRAGARRFVLAVAAHTLWFPSQAVLLDPDTGRVVDEYWHPGALLFSLVTDLDRDGLDEIVLSGINNPGDDLGHGTIVVLRVPFSATPRDAGRELAAYTGASEAGYALLPRPDMCGATGSLPFAREIALENGHLRVQTSCGDASFFTFLDTSLRPLGVRFGNNYAPFHARLEHEGHLDHPLTEDERACLGRVAAFRGAVDSTAPALQTRWQGCQ